MFAINHAASALLFKKHLKTERWTFLWLFLGVQFIELLWVTFNFLGIEHTTTNNTVRYIGDIHLSYMPYSHSVLSTIVIALLATIITFTKTKNARTAMIIAAAFSIHIILDFVTHDHDIPLTPADNKHIGLSLYQNYPLGAFLLEIAFGIFCWWYYRGNRKLLVTIILFNLANFTFFFPTIDGPEVLLAHHPQLITSLILFQIVLTLYLVWRYSQTRKNSKPA